MTRYQKVMNGAAVWGSYYRYHPDRFAEDYLHIRLKIFQRILIVMMFWSTIFVLIACRGIGKTFISAVYCVIRCILYPGTKVCIASGTRGQAINVLEKIVYELKPLSPELRAEINEKETQINGTKAQIVFHNTSMIKVVTASDSARGNRCNVLILDEFRLIDLDTINTVLRKFLTLRRMPRYEQLTDAQRKVEYDKEENLSMYLSSAYFKTHWSYQKCIDTFKAMMNPSRHQFVCGFPYQLSLQEGLLKRSDVEDEMSETNFSEIKFNMEMSAEFYGAAEGAFFDLDSIYKNRRIKYPMYPQSVAAKLGSYSEIRIKPKQHGEVRILSADIAVMSSKKHNNDATAVYINQMLPTKSGRYCSNYIYTDSWEGMMTQDQALIIRKWFDEFDCDYIVLDANGVGSGIYDLLIRDIVDPETGEIYPALGCCNNSDMADRCMPGAPKVIWAIKASAQFNSDCAYLLREGFRSGRIRMLMNEYDAKPCLESIPKYTSLSPAEQMVFQMPYIHTSLAVDELVNLQHEDSGGKIRITEKAGRRKDRYSSLSYNNYVALQIENKITKRKSLDVSSKESFVIKPPSYKGKAVNKFANYHIKRY